MDHQQQRGWRCPDGDTSAAVGADGELQRVVVGMVSQMMGQLAVEIRREMGQLVRGLADELVEGQRAAHEGMQYAIRSWIGAQLADVKKQIVRELEGIGDENAGWVVGQLEKKFGARGAGSKMGSLETQMTKIIKTVEESIRRQTAAAKDAEERVAVVLEEIDELSEVTNGMVDALNVHRQFLKNEVAERRRG